MRGGWEGGGLLSELGWVGGVVDGRVRRGWARAWVGGDGHGDVWGWGKR